MPLTDSQKTNLVHAVQAAIQAERETGCPRELSVAQWALESGWGVRQPGNNCFGIKKYPGAYGIQMIDTWEVSNGKKLRERLAFATFPTLEACFEKHGKLIAEGPRYRAAWDNYERDLSVENLITDIAKVYATDPGYANKLHVILRMPDVVEALHA